MNAGVGRALMPTPAGTCSETMCASASRDGPGKTVIRVSVILECRPRKL